jgi:hypothetical protein
VSYDRRARAYVFRIGREKVVVTSSGPFGPRYWEYDSAKVKDVRLYERKQLCLLFELESRSRHCKSFVMELSREDYICLVDAVREGLGLPKMDWK